VTTLRSSRASEAAVSDAPHALQYLAPSGLSTPQAEHLLMVLAYESEP
jgi:hypothetical protein